LNECGIACPLGLGKAQVARGLAAGQRALSPRTGLVPGRSVAVGAVDAPLPPSSPGLAALDSRNNRLMWAAVLEIQPAIAAAIEQYGRDRVAVVLGTSTSGMSDGEEALAQRRRDGQWPAQFEYRQQECGSLSTFVARALGLTGPAYTIATACSSSAKVLASARRLIRAGLVDAAVVGGADTLCKMTLNGFNALEALSKDVCNPFSANRDGINIGEGAAAFLLTTEPGAVELLGVGETSDAHHATAPDPEGEGARAAMAEALADAHIGVEDIAYINLHGTATPLNDAMESKAIAALFSQSVPCSSTKSMTGHMLGGTGGVEAAFLWLTLNPDTTSGYLPPHVWDGVADPKLPSLTMVAPHTPLPNHLGLAMLSNAFGFGGSNVSVILGRP
jgi:3-oxoacyl-[acyl-carrier-protein] synthase-1